MVRPAVFSFTQNNIPTFSSLLVCYKHVVILYVISSFQGRASSPSLKLWRAGKFVGVLTDNMVVCYYCSTPMKKIISQIIKHDFTKEFKNFEYEVKFDIKGKNPDLFGCLKKIERCFDGDSRFIPHKIRGGDKLITQAVFYEKNGIEYSYFKYRDAKMLKVKKHSIIKTKKLQHLHHRFKRHNYFLTDLKVRLKKLVLSAEYTGNMVKTRVKDFVLDACDGRIYAVAVTFCTSRNKIQKQFEIEYAGYVPGFRGFKKNNKKQIIYGLLGLSNYIYKCIPKILQPSVERKFEFIKKAYEK